MILKIQSHTQRLVACLNLETNMKIKVELELDTVRDANEIEALMDIIESIRNRDYEEEDE